MGNTISFGFSDFQQTFAQDYVPIVEMINRVMALESGLFEKPISEPLHKLVRYITRTVANSFSALLILVSNGCGTDALKVARSMFESAISILYLRKHPELFDDYVNFRWVKQHKHQEFLKASHPDELKRMKPEIIGESEAEYKTLEPQFAQKPWLKNSWCKPNLRDMAKDVGHELTYAAIYPLTSSVHHLDVVGLVAQSDGEDVEVLPSTNNLQLALANAGWGLFVALDCFNEMAALGMEQEIETMFKDYRSALGKL